MTNDESAVAVLDQLIIADHGDDFWDELRQRIAEEPTVLPTRRKRPTSRVLLAAATVAILLLGVAALVVWPGSGGVQQVDTTPAPEPELEDENGLDETPIPTVEEPSVSRFPVRGSGWFNSDGVVWAGDRFVAASLSFDHPEYWTSVDGTDWDRHDGVSAEVTPQWLCPEGFDCGTDPEIAPVPFHFAQPEYEVLARADDAIIMVAYVRYGIDQRDVDRPEGEEPPGPLLHPDLLALAAREIDCFEEVSEQGQSANTPESARIVYWGRGENSIELSCQHAGHTDNFAVDLRTHLTADEIHQAQSSRNDVELWVEALGSPARRVSRPPTLTDPFTDEFGTLDTVSFEVASSGDMFWAIDEGTLVSSNDGLVWERHPTIFQSAFGVMASRGGHVAVAFTDDTGSPAVSVSHDDGRTWEDPVPVSPPYGPVGSNWGTVGPAGFAYTTEGGPNEGPRLVLVDNGREAFSAALPEPDSQRLPVVGDEHILISGREAMQAYSAADGTLVHEAIWSNEGWISRNLLPIAGAVVVGGLIALVFYRRRSSGTMTVAVDGC